MPKLSILLDCYSGERALIPYAHGEPMLHLLQRVTHRLLSSNRDIDHRTAILRVNGRPIDDYHRPIHLCLRQRSPASHIGAATDDNEERARNRKQAAVVSYYAVRRSIIDIYIHFALHHAIQIRTTNTSTLYELKKHIMYLQGIPCEHQSCFILEGKLLKDNKVTLNDYGVRNGSRLHMVVVIPK